MPLFLTPESIVASELSHDTLETLRNCAYRYSTHLYNQHGGSDSQSLGAICYQRVLQEGSLSHKQEENLLAFYYAHRSLHHQGYWWKASSPNWFATCWLYLHLYRYELQEELAEKMVVAGWNIRPKGRAESAATEIRNHIKRRS